MRIPRMLWVMVLASGACVTAIDGAGADDRNPGIESFAVTPAGQSLSSESGMAGDTPFEWVALETALAGPSLGIIRADAAAETAAGSGGPPTIGLSAERAQLLLRSLTMPGWAQASTGHRKSAMAFALAEVGVWTSFTAFRIQSHLRRETSERTAQLFAGVDLAGRDEEYRRIVGAYISSDEYNQLVVYRDAANLYYDDPVAYRAYIASHLVDAADVWSWNSDESLLRYRAQRKDAQRASIRANTALACAVVNRLLSMVHSARIKTTSAPPRSWNLEVTPAPSEDAFAYRMGVRARF